MANRHYTYKKVSGVYEIGYWEQNKYTGQHRWTCVHVTTDWNEVLSFIADNDIV